MTPEVRAVFLELDGETHIMLRPVTGQEQVWGAQNLTAVSLLCLDQVQLVILIVLGGEGPQWHRAWADEIQAVPDLGVQDVSSLVLEPVWA